MVNQREINKYIKAAGKGCPFSFRRKLKADLQNSLSDFLDTRSECTMEDVFLHFGSPEKFADEYIITLDTAARQKLLHMEKSIKRIIFLGVAVTVLAVTVAAFWIAYENSLSVPRYITTEIQEVK